MPTTEAEAEENKLRSLIKEHTTGEVRAALIFQLTKLVVAHVDDMKVAVQATKARQPQHESAGHAIRVLMLEPDGERLIERAFQADPRKTSIELSYLGADRVRGELEVREGVKRLPVERPQGVLPFGEARH